MAKQYCDWCGANSDKISISKYKTKGRNEEGKLKQKTIKICTCCDAWGVISETWYGFQERLDEMSGLYDTRLCGIMEMKIPEVF